LHVSAGSPVFAVPQARHILAPQPKHIPLDTSPPQAGHFVGANGDGTVLTSSCDLAVWVFLCRIEATLQTTIPAALPATITTNHGVSSEIRAKLTTPGETLPAIITDGSYTLPPSVAMNPPNQNLNDFLHRFGIHFSSRGKQGVPSFVGTFSLNYAIKAGGYAPGEYIITEVTPGLVAKLKIKEFLEKANTGLATELSEREFLNYLKFTSGLSKGFFLQHTTGVTNPNEDIPAQLLGGQGEGKVMLEFLKELKTDPELTSDREWGTGVYAGMTSDDLHFEPSRPSDALSSNFRTDLLISQQKTVPTSDGTENVYVNSVFHEMKQANMAYTSNRDGVFSNLFQDLLVGAEDCLDEHQNPTMTIGIFHIADQGKGNGFNLLLNEIQTGRRAGNYISDGDVQRFENFDAAQMRGVWIVDANTKIDAQFEVDLISDKMASYTVRYKVLHRQADGSWKVEVDRWNFPLVLRLVQDLPLYGSLLKTFRDFDQHAKGQPWGMTRASFERWRASDSQNYRAVVSQILGESLTDDELKQGLTMYRFYVHLALVTFGTNVVLSPEHLREMFGRFHDPSADRTSQLRLLRDALSVFGFAEHAGKILGGIRYSLWMQRSAVPSTAGPALKMVDIAHKQAIAKHRIVEIDADVVAESVVGSGLKNYLHAEGDAWKATSPRDIVLLFEQAMSSLRAFLPVGLQDGLVGSVSTAMTQLKKALDGLGFEPATVLTRIYGPNVALTNEGKLVLQAWLDACKAVLAPQLARANMKLAAGMVDANTQDKGRRELLAGLLVKAWAAGDWVSQIPGITSFLHQSPILQFPRECVSSGFTYQVKKGGDGYFYARIRWAPVHDDGFVREFIVRFRGDGNLYRNGFEVFAAWTATGIPGVASPNHFYSTIPSAQMDAVWTAIGTPSFDPASLAGFGHIPASLTTPNAPWLLDLVDPPDPLPPGFPHVTP
jgi:hypothetical protein